mmetsp:Transcript_9602/g.23931  ORF Transcript_9602/g.23931 Transcript_9602/m.23931 type:complete len:208 (-) Transcript_9602:406-1029(-)
MPGSLPTIRRSVTPDTAEVTRPPKLSTIFFVRSFPRLRPPPPPTSGKMPVSTHVRPSMQPAFASPWPGTGILNFSFFGTTACDSGDGPPPTAARIFEAKPFTSTPPIPGNAKPPPPPPPLVPAGASPRAPDGGAGASADGFGISSFFGALAQLDGSITCLTRRILSSSGSSKIPVSSTSFIPRRSRSITAGSFDRGSSCPGSADQTL